MGYGIKISKTGKDATKVGPKDLILDTSYPLLKIKQYGTGTLDIADGGSDNVTITHDLGYVPKVLVFGQTYSLNNATKESGYKQYSYAEEQVSFSLYSLFVYNNSSTQLSVTGGFYDGSAYSGSFDFYYYIFYDEA